MRFLPDQRLYDDTPYCLDYAKNAFEDLSTGDAQSSPVIFHFYWRGGMSRKVLFALKSFLATQNLSRINLWLWLDCIDPRWKEAREGFSRQLGSHVVIRPYEAQKEAVGTPLQGMDDLLSGVKGKLSSIPSGSSDAMRLIVLHRYGGVYIDADTMALRDFTPLLVSDLGRDAFCYRWSGRQAYSTNAICRVSKHTDLGAYLLERARELECCHARLLLAHEQVQRQDFLELPCSLFDPLWPYYDGNCAFPNRPYNRFSDFFRHFGLFFRPDPSIQTYQNFFPGAFSYQWHGLWAAQEWQQSYFGLFESEMDMIVRDLGVCP